MKVTIIPKTLSILTLILMVTCCKKPVESDLPQLTCEGNNTFGCYIDGEPFVAGVSFSIGGPAAVSGSFNEETRLLSIQGKREGSGGNITKVAFRVIIDQGVGKYSMDASSDDYVGFRDIGGPKCTYYHDTLNRGEVVIMCLDEQNRIISGLFAVDLINSDCYYETMRITEGRFDFGY